MRKLKLQVQTSVNGFIAGPQGEMDWMTWNWDDALKNYITELTASIDCIVLGRKLAEGFIPYWAGAAVNPDDPENQAAGRTFTDTPKVVFSKTLAPSHAEESKWANTVIENGDLKARILEMKRQEGKDIIAYGGAEFVSSLIREDLIDEYHLILNPAAIPQGMPIWGELQGKRALSLVAATAHDCGIAVLKYMKAEPEEI